MTIHSLRFVAEGYRHRGTCPRSKPGHLDPNTGYKTNNWELLWFECQMSPRGSYPWPPGGGAVWSGYRTFRTHNLLKEVSSESHLEVGFESLTSFQQIKCDQQAPSLATCVIMDSLFGTLNPINSLFCKSLWDMTFCSQHQKRSQFCGG